MVNKASPIYVNLDRGLLNTYLLMEVIVLLVKKSPINLIKVPLWLLKGTLFTKARFEELAGFDPALLPYNKHLLSFLDSEQKKGRKVYLTNSSSHIIGKRISEYLGFSDYLDVPDTKESDSVTDKIKSLSKNHEDFTYVCDAKTGVEAQRTAKRLVIVANRDDKAYKNIDNTSIMELIDRPKTSLLDGILKGMRPHQWSKNLLLFAAPLLGDRITDLTIITYLSIAFICFCFLASGVYLINDSLDVNSDRAHPEKKKRPIASGQLPLTYALSASFVLIFFSLLISYQLDTRFFMMLGIYFIVTNIYTFYLKKIVLVDVIVLAFLYTWRILTGAVVSHVPVSFWLLAFSMFFFLSLALAKRSAEFNLKRVGKVLASRGYVNSDQSIVSTLGVTSGFSSLVILTFYLDSHQVNLYFKNPEFLWFIVILMLFWISRLWIKSSRGEFHHDPVVFALKDLTSYIVAGGCFILAFLGKFW